MIRFASYTDVGTRKPINEDSHCIEHAVLPLGEAVMAVVCDGVGGLSSGDYVSNLVVDMFADWFESFADSVGRGASDLTPAEVLDNTRNAWGALLATANQEIKAHSELEGKRSGTTFSGLLAFGGRYLVGQVGDSRVYHLGSDGIAQLTQDQTWVARELARGTITAQKAKTHPKRNMILQAVGSQSNLRPVFSSGEYAADDMFVLCCDGFYHNNPAREIFDAFSPVRKTDNERLRKTCAALTRKAMDLGERDNITVCVVEMDGSFAYGPEPVLHDDTTTRQLYDEDCPTADLGQ